MNRDMLERLAANPHKKMTPKQLEELQRLRAQENVQHPTNFPTHPTEFETHPTEPRRAGDVKPIR